MSLWRLAATASSEHVSLLPLPTVGGSLPYASTHLTANKVAGLCPARAAPSGSSHPPYLAVHQGFLCVAFDFPASTSHRVFLGGGYAASSFGSLIQNLTLPTVFNVPKEYTQHYPQIQPCVRHYR